MTRAWSAVGLVALALGLAGAGRWSTASVLELRNTLGYAHFALAYIFTWAMMRRQLGGRVAGTYVAVFLALVAAYAVAQVRWLPRGVNDVFVVSLFAVHHFANEILIGRQEANGYRSFAWGAPDTLVVALVTGLVVLERAGGSFVASVWAAGWAVYVWTQRRSMPRLLAGLGLAALAVLAFGRPLGRPILTSRLGFDWLVIYHYVLWYVFYTRKLRSRVGAWTARRPAASAAAVWTYVTTVPAGFVALVVVANVALVAALTAAGPLAVRAEAATGIDAFQVNTVAHILFGVGVARLAARTAQPTALENSTGASPAAIALRRAS